MSSENSELVMFELPYSLSIAFGTMPTKLELRRIKLSNVSRVADVNRKFVAVTILWITLVTLFLIKDTQAILLWNPTQFFSMKVVNLLPNDFFCMRLVHNVEIWVVLILCIKSTPKLPRIIENFHALRYSGLSDKWEQSKRKHLKLIYFYGVISIFPIAFELFLLLSETSDFDFQQLLQGTLHCIPLTVNLQFCSLCILLAFQFELLNEEAAKNRGSLTPISVRHISQKHSEICDLTHRMYKIYEWQLLAETTIVTFTVFLYTYYALDPTDIIWDGYGDVFYCILWIVHYAGRLFTTCMSVSKVIAEAEETSKVIILMEDSYRLDESHNEVTLLVNRAQNQDIRFDVCGFFHLDGALIVSICRWCISFILILLQFRKPT